MPWTELARLASSEHHVAATYYQQLDAPTRIPDTNDWDRLRRIADTLAFQGYAEHIQFAALSPGEEWPRNYGQGAVFFRQEMIEHRASVFEDNTVTWLMEQGETWQIPPGYRAPWDERDALGLAKLLPVLHPADVDFGAAILAVGDSTATDSFIEVHIYGPFTARTCSHVQVQAGYLGELALAELRESAERHGFEFTEVAS